MSGALSELVVDLKVNSAALKSGLDSAEGYLKHFGEKIEHISESLKGFAEMKGVEWGKELIVGLAEFVQKGAEAAAKMGELAQAAGVPVEKFSALNFAASMAGVGTEELSKGFTKLNVNLAAAGAGTAKQVGLFSALGIAVKDSSGHVRDSGAVMTDLAAKFSGLQDGASKVALAVDLFGKSGASLIPFLNEGAKGIEEYERRARNLGMVLSTEAAESAHHFEQSVTTLHMALQSIGMQVAAQVTPALTKLTSDLVDSKEGMATLQIAVTLLTISFKALLTGAVLAAAVIETPFTDAISAAATAAERIKTIWATAMPKGEEHGKKASADGILAGVNASEKAAIEADAALKSLNKTLSEYQLRAVEAAASDKGWRAEIAAKLDSGPIAGELKKIGKEADAMHEKLRAAAEQLHLIGQVKLDAKLKFELSQSYAATDRAAELKGRDFTNVGSTPFQINDQRKGGYDSFEAALSAYATQTKESARLTAEAQKLEDDGKTELAREDLAAANSAKVAAERASQAADAFKTSAETLHSMIVGAASGLASKLGSAGEVINAAAQGFSSGGPVGAIVGVIVAIISKLQAFSVVSDSMNRYLQKALDMIDGVIGPFVKAFVGMSEAFTDLTKVVLQASGALDIISAVLFVLSKVFDILALGALSVAKFFADMAGGNQDINNKIKDTLYDLNKGYNQVDAPPPPLPTVPLNQLGTAASDAAKSVSKMTEQLTNVPQGFKVALRTFQAMEAGGAGAATTAAAGLSGPKAGSATEAAGQTTYHSSGYYNTSTTEQTNDSVSQDQRSESTRPPGPGNPNAGQAGYNSNGVAIDAPDANYWAAFYAAIAQGYDIQTAMAIAYAAQQAAKTRGSSSSAATAAVGGGGGNSGIHQVGGGGDPTTVNVHIAGGVMTTLEDITRAVRSAISKASFRRHGFSKELTDS